MKEQVDKTNIISVKEMLMDVANDLPITDLSSMKLVSSSLSLLTRAIDEINEKSAVKKNSSYL